MKEFNPNKFEKYLNHCPTPLESQVDLLRTNLIVKTEDDIADYGTDLASDSRIPRLPAFINYDLANAAVISGVLYLGYASYGQFYNMGARYFNNGQLEIADSFLRLAQASLVVSWGTSFKVGKKVHEVWAEHITNRSKTQPRRHLS